MPVTIHNVARRAKVSIGTASRVLNGGTKGVRRDAQERAERIMRAAVELGYQPNMAAKAIATGRTGHFGYIISDDIQGGITNQFYGQILAGAEKACSANGYLLNVAVHNLSDIDSFIWPQSISGKSVDGIILAGESISQELIDKFDKLKVPCICLTDSALSSSHVVGLSFDMVHCTCMAIEYAVKLGHKKIAITLKKDKKQHFNEVKAAMKKNKAIKDCELVFMEVDAPNFDNAETVFQKFKTTSPKHRPEVILTSDQCALGLLNMLNSSEFSCPDDLSIISLSDSFLLDLVMPPITAVKINLNGMGEYAINTLLDKVKKRASLDSAVFEDSPEIIERKSVKHIK